MHWVNIIDDNDADADEDADADTDAKVTHMSILLAKAVPSKM